MNEGLFIVRGPSGEILDSFFESLEDNLFESCESAMSSVRYLRPTVCVYCCEVWTRTDPHTMNLLVTVFDRS